MTNKQDQLLQEINATLIAIGDLLAEHIYKSDDAIEEWRNNRDIEIQKNNKSSGIEPSKQEQVKSNDLEKFSEWLHKKGYTEDNPCTYEAIKTQDFTAPYSKTQISHFINNPKYKEQRKNLYLHKGKMTNPNSKGRPATTFWVEPNKITGEQ